MEVKYDVDEWGHVIDMAHVLKMKSHNFIALVDAIHDHVHSEWSDFRKLELAQEGNCRLLDAVKILTARVAELEALQLDDNEIGMALDGLEYKINKCAGEFMTFPHERALATKLKQHLMRKMGWAEEVITACTKQEEEQNG